MSQNPLIDLGIQSSTPVQLKPALAAALASLEVKLDQELARYRRTKTVYRNLSQPRVGSFTSSQLQQLTLLSMKESVKNTSQESGTENQKEPPATVTAAATSLSQQEELSVPDQTNTPSIPSSQTFQQTPVTPKTEELQNLTITANTTEITNSTSIVSTVTPQAPESNNKNPVQPDDFLDSSEALLRSLAEEQTNTPKQTNPNNSLLSPLGIGSMLLLLLASLTFGFVVFNPKSISQFNLKGVFTSKTTTKVENTAAQSKKTKLGDEPALTPIPKYPNLAQRELPEVRDPNDVVGLKPKPNPTSISSPYSISTTNPSTTPYQLQPIQPVAPTINNSPPILTATTPLSPFSQKPVAIDTQIKPSKDGFYHIVTENQGLQAFNSARKIVPDAYLSADGKFIYMGAVKNKDKAQQLIQQLEAKGIKARVQP
ncbi:hypothetical protein G7B40_006900 [Aetokthonos hydrillicola Thurmond2011]|jgi:cell division septation protein DedD|uniref:SPOR domain-containing protein n=1 Tax=Aetokthonos hydrillicola Thurmond2011 TaxID=2712845 RepID=A0AAP5I888_9CYAN|nr:hypothetical protein [Aetokthonos hydrillicola]MBO3463520.1 hypothetical protein [Aetokthonos hydrillicola CCALA 1050]MBW4584941.1 hypothetical protein [Aetokthonos hydrillicola CCALA 1050]MDR9894300.1 hypothetical protein [Aetokthonos hydrillicola Thurmond2011]